MLGRLRNSYLEMVRQVGEIRHLIEMVNAKADAANLKTDSQAVRVETVLSELEAVKRENRTLLGQLSLPAPALWRGGPAPPAHPAPSAGIFSSSTGCRQDMFEAPYFGYWLEQVGYSPRYHRKLWEFVFICQTLAERGMLAPGMRGLGFGVGEEPLSAVFAARGCHILGTDMAPEAAADAGWSETQQHAAGKAALRWPSLCPDARFEANVQFRVADMNAVPDDLTGFDFCWSACALEHLGSIEHGLAFIERSLDCLRPGGFAVHTTEFNLSSNDETIDNAGTVLFRRRDLEALARRLGDGGHIMAPLDFSDGDAPLDRYIDVPPYRDEPHLRLALEGYACTSFGVIVQKRL